MHNLDKKFDKLALQCANIIKTLNKLSLNYNEDSIKFERTYKKILKRLPKSIKETDLYKKTEKLLNPKDIKLEDLTWLESECWKDKTIIELKNQILIEKGKNNYKLFNYINYVVNDMEIPNREKTIVLLSHFEALLYLTFDEKKVREIKIKNVANNKMKKINELSSNDFGLLLAIAITEIVFARTDYFDNPKNIDHRLPFRNNILHNGILSYSEADIDWVYKILLSFILKIMQIKNKLDKTKK